MGSIIAISQERGSGGDLIGPALAERLGYRFLDRELIHEAARVVRLVKEGALDPGAAE